MATTSVYTWQLSILVFGARPPVFPCTKIRMLSSLPVVGKVKAMVGEDAPVDAATLYVPGVIGDIVKMSEAALYEALTTKSFSVIALAKANPIESISLVLLETTLYSFPLIATL